MTNTDYTRQLDALENALVVLSDCLKTAPNQEASEDTAQLQAEIARLEENQATAQKALDEATQLIRQMLDNQL